MYAACAGYVLQRALVDISAAKWYHYLMYHTLQACKNKNCGIICVCTCKVVVASYQAPPPSLFFVQICHWGEPGTRLRWWGVAHIVGPFPVMQSLYYRIKVWLLLLSSHCIVQCVSWWFLWKHQTVDDILNNTRFEASPPASGQNRMGHCSH